MSTEAMRIGKPTRAVISPRSMTLRVKTVWRSQMVGVVGLGHQDRCLQSVRIPTLCVFSVLDRRQSGRRPVEVLLRVHDVQCFLLCCEWLRCQALAVVEMGECAIALVALGQVRVPSEAPGGLIL
jgi:hypothetical protein